MCMCLAYLQVGDEILEVDGTQVDESNIIAVLAGPDTPNQLVKIKVIRVPLMSTQTHTYTST
jgi:hypothetical protein